MISTRQPRVRVDHDRCQGHGRCHALAPELFDLDDVGHARVVGDGAVSEALAERALRAVRNCPEGALALAAEDGAAPAGGRP